MCRSDLRTKLDPVAHTITIMIWLWCFSSLLQLQFFSVFCFIFCNDFGWILNTISITISMSLDGAGCFFPLLLLLLRAQKLCRPWMLYSYKVIMILIIVLVIASDLYLFFCFFFFFSAAICLANIAVWAHASNTKPNQANPSDLNAIEFVFLHDRPILHSLILSHWPRCRFFQRHQLLIYVSNIIRVLCDTFHTEIIAFKPVSNRICAY